MNSCRNIALTFGWHLIIKGTSSTASTMPYPPISLAVDNKMMFLTKENKKTPTNKSSLLYVHLHMEYLTAGGLVTYSTSDTFYTSTEMAITILCNEICNQLATFPMLSLLTYSSVLYVNSFHSAGYLTETWDSLQHPLHLQNGAKVPQTWFWTLPAIIHCWPSRACFQGNIVRTTWA